MASGLYYACCSIKSYQASCVGIAAELGYQSAARPTSTACNAVSAFAAGAFASAYAALSACAATRVTCADYS